MGWVGISEHDFGEIERGRREMEEFRKELDPAGFTPEQAIIAQTVDPACWNAAECEIMNPSSKRSMDDGSAIIV